MNIHNLFYKDYLEVNVEGKYSLSAYLKGLDDTLNFCSSKQLYKILFNLIGVQGDQSVIDRHMLGERTAALFRGKYKIAAIARKEAINKHAENVAFNRGVNILVTHDKEAGLNWLLDDD
jgi:hypothetical protein